MTQTEALRLALEALENAREFFISTQELGIRLGVSAKDVRLGERFIADRAITAIKAALANEALERKAENARELGLDYESVALKPCAYESKEKNMCRKCGQVHAEAILDTTTPQQEKNEFNPDWDTQAVLTEEIQRMAKRIEELEARGEPVGYFSVNDYGNWEENESNNGTPLYTQPQRKPLTDDEIKEAVLDDPFGGLALLSMMRDEVMIADVRQAINRIARAIEAAHGIKGKA
jgi:hypothetical protein